MKVNRLIATVLGVCCVLILQAGCEEEAARPQRLDPSWFRQFDTQFEQSPAYSQPPAYPQPPAYSQPPARAMPPTVAQSVKRPEPRITFDKRVHNFGDVGLKTQRLAEFTFTNTGDGVLSIGAITKSCGSCTAFQLDKGEYGPGESGTLKVKFYADTQPGQTTKNLTIHSNDPVNPDLVIAVTAKVISKIEFEPKELNLLLKQANGGCPKIKLTSTDGQPFAISHFKSTADCISIDYDPSVKAMEFVLEPKIDMARLAGNLSGRIEIGLTHPECMAVQMGVRTVPMYRFSPIFARGAKPNESLVKRVQIISNYNKNFAIASVSSRKGTATVVNTKSIGNGYELEVAITPPTGKKLGIFSETLLVNTGNGDQIEIPCNVYFAGARVPAPTAKKAEKCTHCGPRIIYRDGTIKARDF